MSNKKYFIIYTLPRSGSAWVANFLTIPGYSIALHDPLCEVRSVRDLKARLDSYPEKYVGIVDTLAYRVFANLRAVFPEARTVQLRRREKEIQQSLANINASEVTDAEWALFNSQSRYVDLVVNYGNLFSRFFDSGKEATLLLETVLGKLVPCPAIRTQMLLSFNVQRNPDSYRERGWRNIASLLSEKIEYASDPIQKDTRRVNFGEINESPSERGTGQQSLGFAKGLG